MQCFFVSSSKFHQPRLVAVTLLVRPKIQLDRSIFPSSPCEIPTPTRKRSWLFREDVYFPFNEGLTNWTMWWFQIFFYVHPYLGKRCNLTNMFQLGWNHQLVKYRLLIKLRGFFFVLRSGQTLWSFRNVATRGKKVWNICRAWKFSSRTSLRAWFLGHGGSIIWVNYRDLNQGHPTSTNNVFFSKGNNPLQNARKIEV